MNWRMAFLIVLLALAFIGSPSWATIEIESVSSRSSSSSLLWVPHITGGSPNRLLVVGVSVWNDDFEQIQDNGVRYSGANLSRVGTVTNSDDSRVEIWALVNPPTGFGIVTIFFSEQVQGGAVAGVIGLSGVDQNNPFDLFNESFANSGNSSRPTISVPSATGDLVLGVLATRQLTSNPFALQGSQSWALRRGFFSPTIAGAGATRAGDNSTTIEWALSSTRPWAVGAISINPVNSAPPAPLECETYRDEFNTASFSNNNGTINWVSSWDEFDIDGSGTSNGDIRITNGRLRITGKDNRTNNNRITRRFSTNGYTSATLSFDYDPSSGLESDDRMYVEISTNGGSSYVPIDILQGLNGNPSNQIYTASLSEYLADDVHLRFRVYEDNGSGSCCFGPDSEYIDFDNIQVEVCKPASSQQQVAYYKITHPSSGLTCDASTVNIEACSNEDCTSLHPEPVSISFPLTATTRQTLTFTGSTEANVSRSTAGSVSLDIQAQNDDALAQDPTQCNGDCTIDFRNAAFVFVDPNNNLSTLLPDIVAESPLSQIGLRALRDNQGACVAALVGARQVNLGFDCIANPSYSTNTCKVAFAGVAVQGDGTATSTGEVTLTFNDQGVATLPASSTYNDAGRLHLYASGTYTDFSIDSGDDGAQLDSIPKQLNLVTNAPNLTVAGEQFDMQIEALGEVGLSPLPSYAPAQLQYRYERTAPSDTIAQNKEARLSLGLDATLTSRVSSSFSDLNSLAFTNGSYQNALASNNEVGEYQLTVRDLNYLGSDVLNTVISSTNQLGRFIPAYFDVNANAPRLEPTCNSSFSYIGEEQAFELGREPIYTITAYNAQRQLTQLYSMSEWRLQPTANELKAAFTATDNSAFGLTISLQADGLTTNLADTDFNGYAELLIDNLQVQYNKPDLPDSTLSPFAAKFTLKLNSSALTDDDGVCYRPDYVDTDNQGSCSSFDITNIGDAEQRYGRLNLVNSYGPETRAIRAPIRAEYYDRGNWLINNDDNCTTIDFEQAQNELTVTNASAATEANIVAYYTSISSSGTLKDGLSALTDLRFDAPLNGERGGVRISLNPSVSSVEWPDHLNIDWDGDGDIDNDDSPSALISFGLFRGNDRIFHTREVR